MPPAKTSRGKSAAFPLWQLALLSPLIIAGAAICVLGLVAAMAANLALMFVGMGHAAVTGRTD